MIENNFKFKETLEERVVLLEQLLLLTSLNLATLYDKLGNDSPIPNDAFEGSMKLMTDRLNDIAKKI